MKEQIHKLKETGPSVSFLKGEHVDADSEDAAVHFPLKFERKLVMRLYW